MVIVLICTPHENQFVLEIALGDIIYRSDILRGHHIILLFETELVLKSDSKPKLFLIPTTPMLTLSFCRRHCASSIKYL